MLMFFTDSKGRQLVMIHVVKLVQCGLPVGEAYAVFDGETLSIMPTIRYCHSIRSRLGMTLDYHPPCRHEGLLCFG